MKSAEAPLEGCAPGIRRSTPKRVGHSTRGARLIASILVTDSEALLTRGGGCPDRGRPGWGALPVALSRRGPCGEAAAFLEGGGRIQSAQPGSPAS